MHRLRQSYEAIPAGAPVRLAKRTSNLFRPRADVTTPGLDVSGLRGVVALDPRARTADVQGMCTYEDLVDATLAHGLMPLVVPQLRTITLGGAVTGLGIESTSFRNGLPHESVLEMDVLTGAGDLVTATPDGDHADLFATFPNSYGSLGYATRLRIELEPVAPYVALRHVRFDDLDALAEAVDGIVADRSWEGEPVDFLDGVVFEPGEAYLTLATWTDDPARRPRATTPGRRSTTARPCTRRDGPAHLPRLPLAVGHRLVLVLPGVRRPGPAGPPAVAAPVAPQRRLPPAGRAGEPVRAGGAGRTGGAGGRPASGWSRTSRCRSRHLAEFLRWFDDAVPIEPVWLCPLRLREPGRERDRRGRRTRCARHHLRQRRLLGDRADRPGRAGRRRQPRGRGAVTELGGHKSLYSDAYYDRATFDRLYDGANLARVKDTLRPRQPAHRPLREGGDASMTLTTTEQITIGEVGRPADRRTALPCRMTAYDGSARARPTPRSCCTCAPQRGLAYLLTAPGDLGVARAYVMGDLDVEGVHPGDPYEVMRMLMSRPPLPGAAARRAHSGSSAALGLNNLKPPPPPPQEHLRAGAGCWRGCGTPSERDAVAIQHHYDVSNRSTSWCSVRR